MSAGRPREARIYAAVAELRRAGYKPRHIAAKLNVPVERIYQINHRVFATSPVFSLGPTCARCGLRGAHHCLSATSIRWRTGR